MDARQYPEDRPAAEGPVGGAPADPGSPGPDPAGTGPTGRTGGAAPERDRDRGARDGGDRERDDKERDRDAKEPLRVGTAVRKRRRALRLTLAAVSARSGLSVPFLSQIENERARPSMRSLERVADALETTAVELLAASDSTRTVDLVRADDRSALVPVPGVRPLVRGHHQLHALEFTGEQDAGREYQHRNDELMYVISGACQVEAEGRAYRLESGDALFLSGGVRHRWRATGEDTRILVVAVGDHIEATPQPPGRR